MKESDFLGMMSSIFTPFAAAITSADVNDSFGIK
jgi:hypothetical protein